jgi:hypothetical protein
MQPRTEPPTLRSRILPERAISDCGPTLTQDFRHHTQSPLCLDDEDHRVLCGDLCQEPVGGNVRSHIYHWPRCPNYDDISPGNRVEFANALAAVQTGFRAARNCL